MHDGMMMHDQMTGWGWLMMLGGGLLAIGLAVLIIALIVRLARRPLRSPDDAPRARP